MGLIIIAGLHGKRRIRRGWPKGKLRKPQIFTEMALNTIEGLSLKPETKKLFEDLIRACVP